MLWFDAHHPVYSSELLAQDIYKCGSGAVISIHPFSKCLFFGNFSFLLFSIRTVALKIKNPSINSALWCIQLTLFGSENSTGLIDTSSFIVSGICAVYSLMSL